MEKLESAASQPASHIESLGSIVRRGTPQPEINHDRAKVTPRLMPLQALHPTVNPRFRLSVGRESPRDTPSELAVWCSRVGESTGTRQRILRCRRRYWSIRPSGLSGLLCFSGWPLNAVGPFLNDDFVKVKMIEMQGTAEFETRTP